MVFNVNEMVPHVPTAPTCLNALSVPMLRQVSAEALKHCKKTVFERRSPQIKLPKSVLGKVALNEYLHLVVL